ncbi:MAG: hypothetical protein IJ806_07235 [Ruminococcus sp.]|nr:hypothetical protein [Ruminococcus sp.]
MDERPLYEFPPKLSRAEKQAKAVNDIAEHTKMRRQMYKNMVLAALIFALSFLVPAAPVKILLMLISVGNFAVGALLYRYYSLSRDTELYTRIYEDRLEHCQNNSLSGRKLSCVIYFDEIEKSWQDNRGRLNIAFSSQERSRFTLSTRKDGARPYELKGAAAVLRFADTASKLRLINDYWEKIKYPKKNYKEITDDDSWYSEEDLKWDKLHKHGL